MPTISLEFSFSVSRMKMVIDSFSGRRNKKKRCTLRQKISRVNVSSVVILIKRRSEIVWHRFFAVPGFMCRFRSYIAVRKLFLKTSSNFSSRLCDSACFWQSPDILRKSEISEMRPQTKLTMIAT